MIRLTVPSIEDDDLEAVRQVLTSGFLIQGKYVAEFERSIAKLTGSKHAVAVANCTCALHLSLMALGVSPGDICVVPAYSWISTANVIALCGAQPEFVDIDSQTLNMDPERLEEALAPLMSDPSTAKRVKAVLVVHTFGQMADMEAIAGICERWNIPLIEDAACALGASLNGRQAGSIGVMGCFSFHPRKAITTGEGGMVITDDATHAGVLRALRNHGADPASATPDFIMPGHNYRLTEFQGAMGLSQMAKLNRVVDARRGAAARYDDLLSRSSLESPAIASGGQHVYQSYVVLLPSDVAATRPAIIKKAAEQAVELQVGTIHMPLTSYFRQAYNYKPGDFPVTDDVAARSLTLPLFERITCEQQTRVVEVIEDLLVRAD